MNGSEFRELRLKKGFKSRRKLAEWLGRSYWAVQRWENETRPVPSYAVYALRHRRDAPKAKGEA